MTNLPQINALEWVAIDRELSSRSLADFVKLAWKQLEPENPYVHGWHIDAVCEHLEAVTNGDIKRLLINVPPGTMKSLLVNVFWPVWEWGPKGLPAMRYMAASHAQDLSIRDNLKMRRLVESVWYQERWPTPLTVDQNAKIKFENQKTGFRQACALASMTGNRGDRVILDDPHTVEAALSEVMRETALRIFTETVPTRLNNPEYSAIIVVMQRLHEEDISGYIVANNLGYEHLMLPMEYEPDRCCITSLGRIDRRTQEGELLFPERFPRSVVDADKKALGVIAVAGQFQQRPAPREGAFFDWTKLFIVDSLPEFRAKVRYWDKAGTQGGGCYTAGALLGLPKDEADPNVYIIDMVRGQWAAPAREKMIKDAAENDGKDVHIWVEQEGGSGGKESASATIANLRGFTCRADSPTGDKVTRAEPYSVQVEAGHVCLFRGGWNQAFIDEHKTFPRGKYKDQIDATSAAFNKICNPPEYNFRVMVIPDPPFQNHYASMVY